jgi:hypothetical protein
MTPSPGSRLADLILERLAEVIEFLTRIDRRQRDLEETVDAIDRWLRPYGDGTKLQQRQRRGG